MQSNPSTTKRSSYVPGLVEACAFCYQSAEFVQRKNGFKKASNVARELNGVSQEKLPLYLAFFQFVHNTRKRGKALLNSLVERLLT